MDVFLNGEFVPEEEATVSVFDRGVLYGDGVYETLRVYHGKPFLLDRHLGRLSHSLGSLHIPEKLDFGDYLEATRGIIERNQVVDGVLRIHVTRGVGKRGFSSTGNYNPTVIISLHDAPPITNDAPAQLKLISATSVLSDHDPFSTLKTTNKLVNIIAMREAERVDADDALLFNQSGFVTESTSSNVFAVRKGALHTPPLNSGCMAGITRGFVLELAIDLGVKSTQDNLTSQDLAAAEGVFLTNSVREIQPVGTIDGQPIASSKVTDQLRQAYRNHVIKETQ
jgi:aminodeoxychorismate lyase